MSSMWELWKAQKARRAWIAVGRMLIVASCAVLTVAPACVQAVSAYAHMATTPLDPILSFDQPADYYAFPLETIPYLVGGTRLIVLAGLGGVLSIIRRNRLALAVVLWVVVLCLFGEFYHFGIPLISFTNLGAILILMYLPIGLLFGIGIQEFLALLNNRQRAAMLRALPGCAIAVGFLVSHTRTLDIEPYRYFVTSSDVVAMDWIRNNTAPDARFAINTYFWLNNAPHGTDGGYWIPYFTGRETTAGVMLMNLGSRQYWADAVTMSRAVERLETDNGALQELRDLGVDYVYIGPMGDFSGRGLDASHIAEASEATIVYQQDGVSILRVED